MAHKNTVICPSRVISRAVKLFAGRSQSELLAQSGSRAGLSSQPALWMTRQRQLMLTPALAGSCWPGKQAWQTESTARGSLRAFDLVSVFQGEIFRFLEIPEDAEFSNWK